MPPESLKMKILLGYSRLQNLRPGAGSGGICLETSSASDLCEIAATIMSKKDMVGRRSEASAAEIEYEVFGINIHETYLIWSLCDALYNKSN